MPVFLLLVCCLSAGAAPAGPVVPPAAQASSHFNVDAATNAWLATVSPENKSKSDRYYEGGYVLMVVDLLWLTAAMLLLLLSRASARWRTFAAKLVRVRALQVWVYWIGFCTATSLLMFPLTIYEGFLRERSYGLMNQSFGGWFKDALIGFVVIGLLLGGPAYIILVAVVRRFPKTWPVWGTLVATLLVIFTSFIEPVFLAPLFNTYTPLANGPLKSSILSLARGNGISARDVYEENASKQSNRVSAFVSGFGATERITLNDNLLNRVSPGGVLSVMGHEMGHYVMHHIANGILFSLIVFAIAFALLRRLLTWGVARFGGAWDVTQPDDVALLPFAVLVLALMSFLFTPIGNTFTRTQEFEADLYGLNAARQPDGEAEVDILLGEYRKLDPSPLEEFLFYDHPSGRTRIRAAMRWKAENMCLFLPGAGCGTS